MNTKLDFALAYIARGWAIFPADSSGAKKSHKSAKYSNGVPWGATTDADQIRIDFNEWPGCGIGIVTGRTSGIFVTEIDTKEGHGVDGIASLHALQIQYGELPVTRKVRADRVTIIGSIRTTSRSRTARHGSAPALTCAATAASSSRRQASGPARVSTSGQMMILSLMRRIG
jgi:hypothetical protein